MKVIATNTGRAVEITWNGKREKTGIYKTPKAEGIVLEKEQVSQDAIANRKVHGGIDKACYLFSADQYPYWKDLYPNLAWDWGMFGENLTVEGLDEAKIRIGNTYEVGGALVQISQPREPCYKLGVRFGSQEILRQFIQRGYPGTYVRILREGRVCPGDPINLRQTSANPLTVKQFYDLLFTREKDQEILQLALANDSLPLKKRAKLKRFAN